MSNEQFTTVCSPIFEEIKDKLDTIDKKLFEGNGQESLMTRVALLESTPTVPAQQPTLTGKPNTTKIELGPFKMSTNSIEVVNTLIKLVVLAGIVYVSFHVLSIKGRLGRIEASSEVASNG